MEKVENGKKWKRGKPYVTWLVAIFHSRAHGIGRDRSKIDSRSCESGAKIFENIFLMGGKMGVEKIPGDPSSFAGESEHSQQVALFAALAQYAVALKKMADDMRMNALFWREDQTYGYASAQAMFDNGERLERMSIAIEWIHAVPNGGSRGSDKRSAMISGANMKAEGVKTGVSDIDIVGARHGYHGFKIELKAPGKIRTIERGARKGERETGESDEQKAYGAYLQSCGYLYAVFDSWVDALQAIRWYLGIEVHPFEWSL